MTCSAGSDMTEVVVLYALGALSQHEARAFEEHLSEGCETCKTELESFASTASALGFSAADESPPARTRAALLSRVTTASSKTQATATPEIKSNQYVSILASEDIWRKLTEGVVMKKLYVDPDTGIATSLVRMMPGTSLPAHKHIGVEQLFILEGDCQVAGQTLKSGDYHRAKAGSIHQSTSTVGGTLFLLIAPERYEILDSL